MTWLTAMDRIWSLEERFKNENSVPCFFRTDIGSDHKV